MYGGSRLPDGHPRGSNYGPPDPITRIPGEQILIRSMRAAAIIVRLAGLRSRNPL